MNFFTKMKPILFEAGQAILDVYKTDDFDIFIKKDSSPVTKADKISDEIIVNGIKSFSDKLIISEEMFDGTNNLVLDDYFWLVDPLDGTKDFLAKNDEFSINVSLIKNDSPIFGIIYLPVQDICYWAEKGVGSFRDYDRIYNDSKRTGSDVVGTVSRFHETRDDINFFKKNNVTNIKKFGGAIKFCRMAEGEVDVYPRFIGSSEWDTAAGQLLISESGCKLTDVTTKHDMLYNKVGFRNNNFVAIRNNLIIHY